VQNEWKVGRTSGSSFCTLHPSLCTYFNSLLCDVPQRIAAFSMQFKIGQAEIGGLGDTDATGEACAE
jgi:hypothetical protein